MVGVKLARPLDAKVEYRWRVERVRSADYVADFARIGEQALRRRRSRSPAGPGLDRKPRDGRMLLFKLHFLQLKPYAEVLRMLHLPPSTFEYWSQEIKKYVGRALYHAGLYPPKDYFNRPSKPRRVSPEPAAPSEPAQDT